MRRYTIAKYIRLSLEDSKTESLSIPNQNHILDRHIDSLDIPDVEILEFIDNGYSGTNFERPGVQELLELVRQSKIDCITVKDYSRFGRNMIETGYFLQMVFPLFKTRFISVSDNYDSDDYKGDAGGLEVSFSYLMHEYHSLDLSRKGRTAKYAKMKRGEYQSEVCMYGYRKGAKGRLEIDEDAAAVVRLIFEAALTMKSTTCITKILFEKQIPTPGEYRKSEGIGFHDVSRSIGIWQRSSILRILADERYIGTYIMGKRVVTQVGSNKVRSKDESEWFKIPDHHPAIISHELFEQVNAKLPHFKCPKRDREYLLRTKVVCGCCRHAMTRAPRKSPAFVCRYTQVDQSAECYGLKIGEQKLESLLFEEISKHAKAVKNLDHSEDTDRLHQYFEQKPEYEKAIDQIQADKCTLYERLVLGGISVDEYRVEKSRLDVEFDRLKAAYSSASSAAAKMSDGKKSGDVLMKTADDVLRTDRLTRQMVDLLIEKVYVFPGKQIEIMWKAPGFGVATSIETEKRINCTK